MRRGTKIMLFGIGGTVLAALSGLQLSRLSVEEPAFERITSWDGVEVRRYGPRVVAQTTVHASASQATSEGFRRLAGYIFGGNDRAMKIAMTTPVGRQGGELVPIAGPLARTSQGDGFVITFTMPSALTSPDQLPRPHDPRVELKSVPPETLAALRFRGRATEELTRIHTQRLLQSLSEHGYEPAGEPTLAQYDPPIVIGPLRRNEILVPVRRATPETPRA